MPFDRTFDSFAPLLDQDSRALLSIATHRISIRLPRVGWDHFAHLLGTMMDYFNPPVWGRTAGVSINVRNALISIHPPRVGWDRTACREAALPWGFQSTHPVWGGTSQCSFGFDILEISIHPPRVGWDVVLDILRPRVEISIHPPRVGWDNSAIRSP